MPSCRETVLDHGAVTPLLAQFKEDMKVSVLRTATWTLSNICFGKLPDEVQVGHHIIAGMSFLICEEIIC